MVLPPIFSFHISPTLCSHPFSCIADNYFDRGGETAASSPYGAHTNINRTTCIRIHRDISASFLPSYNLSLSPTPKHRSASSFSDTDFTCVFLKFGIGLV